MAKAGTLSDSFEEDLKEAAEELAHEVFRMADEHGDRPPFRPEWPDELQAAQYLSGWYVYGNAEGEAQEKYWDDILDGIDYVTGEVNISAGPKDALEFNHRMWRFWHTPLLLKTAMLACTEEEAEDFQFLVSEGLHYGHLKPNLDEYIESRSYRQDKPSTPVIPFQVLMEAAARQFGPPPGGLASQQGLAGVSAAPPAPIAMLQPPDLGPMFKRLGTRR